MSVSMNMFDQDLTSNEPSPERWRSLPNPFGAQPFEWLAPDRSTAADCRSHKVFDQKPSGTRPHVAIRELIDAPLRRSVQMSDVEWRRLIGAGL